MNERTTILKITQKNGNINKKERLTLRGNRMWDEGAGTLEFSIQKRGKHSHWPRRKEVKSHQKPSDAGTSGDRCGWTQTEWTQRSAAVFLSDLGGKVENLIDARPGCEHLPLNISEMWSMWSSGSINAFHFGGGVESTMSGISPLKRKRKKNYLKKKTEEVGARAICQ